MKAKPEKFDITSILSSVPVSESDTGRKQIEYIDIDLIEGDPRNFYELRGVPALAENIELLGLQQPLLVRDGEGGKVIIVSGHRRHAALLSLVQEGKEQFRSVPCIREQSPGSEALQELRLIYANSDTRRMTSAEIGKQVERVEALLYQLKEEGFEFPGRMRDHVAQACKISATKIANLKVIRESLIKEFQPLYKKASIAEDTVLTLARMPADHQRKIYQRLTERDGKVSWLYNSTAENFGKYLKQLEKLKCPEGGNCTNCDKKFKRLTKDNWTYDHCSTICCDKCEKLGSCSMACEKLSERIKKLKADAREQSRQEKLAREARELPDIQQIQNLWIRFGVARAAAGASIKAVCKASNRYYSGNGTDKEFEEQEGAWAKTTPSTTLPYGNCFYLRDARSLIAVADLFGVSVDYLLCRTDEPKLASAAAPQEDEQVYLAGWMPGGTWPGHSCSVVAEFDLGTTKTKMLCYYDSDRGQLLFKSAGEAVNMEPLRWIALPD